MNICWKYAFLPYLIDSQYTQRHDNNKQVNFSKLEIIAYIFDISMSNIYTYILLAWALWEQKKIALPPQRWLIPFKAITTAVSASDNTSSTSPDIWNLQTLPDFCCKQGFTGRISKGIRWTLLVTIFYYFVLC